MKTSINHKNTSNVSTEVTKDLVYANPNLNGDWLNFFLLVLLYTMQGLPLGISSSIPILLQSKKNNSYQNQALFSLSTWPFSLKLLWAPIIDTLYMQKIGRRKSWLIPIQYLLGIIILYTAHNIDDLLPEAGKPNITVLTYAFLAITFLAATQDIIVDGWSLTMLKKNNVGYASTCNTAGQAIGILIGTITPILFTSEDFCNKYLRTVPNTGGILTFKSILHILSIMLMSVTTLIFIFKKEKDCTLEDDHLKINVFQNYLLLWNILKLPSVQLFSLALITVKIGFATTENVSTLKFMDAGVPKDDITVISSMVMGINIIIPLLATKYTAGSKPMSIFLKVYPFRLFLNIGFIGLFHYTPNLISFNKVINIPMYYYLMLTLLFLVENILSYIMFTSQLAFFARISDPRFGGTYMTLLNTISNLGLMATSTISLGMIDLLTFRKCSFDSNCPMQDLQKACKTKKCVIVLDGYYIETAICVSLGIVWYIVFGKAIKNLQSRNFSYWLVNIKKPTVKNDKNVYSIDLS